jgi:hypothetical protein
MLHKIPQTQHASSVTADRPALPRLQGTFAHFEGNYKKKKLHQDSARELFNRLMTTLPYQGVSRIEFHMCCLWIPLVSEDVDCFYSVGLGCSWTFTVIHLNDQRDSTLFVSMYISCA